MVLRQKGYSIGHIEKVFGIPRSTLSAWLRNIKLTQKQKDILEKRSRDALTKARSKAILWHNEQKRLRLVTAENNANIILNRINVDINIINLALAILYLGEGFKKSAMTALGNSDPLILKFFISTLKKIYNLDMSKFKCELHLRADQSPKKLKKYWSQQLEIPITSFTSISDPRTKNKKTYPDYKGVCVVRCGSVEIQRELVFLSRQFCQNIINFLN